MFDDLNSYAQHTDFSAQVVIIGSGPAGLALARKLTSKGVDLIIVSSGDDSFDRRHQDLYHGTITENLPALPLSASRLRMFGGTSNHWTGHCAPFDAIDFDSRHYIPNSGWPIGREVLDSYYSEAQDFLELGNHKFSVNLDPVSALGTVGSSDSFQLSLLAQNPFRFGPEWKGFFSSSPNCRVLENANLTGIEFDGKEETVKSVTVKSLSGSSATIFCGSVVLACGGIENARLLLNSSLKDSLPCLGQYYAFHPRVVGSELYLSSPLEKANIFQWHKTLQGYQKFLLTYPSDYQKQSELPNYAMVILNRWEPYSDTFKAAVRLKKGLSEPYKGSITDDLLSVLGNFGSFAREYRRHRNTDKFYSFDLMTYLDPVPDHRNMIELNNERDELGMRRCTATWKPSANDLEFTREFNLEMARYIGQLGIGRVKIKSALYDPEEFKELVRDSSGGGHQMGTTRMSETIDAGVVNSDLRVHGTSNLYCSGSSVFPTYSWANPTMTIVALSARLGDHLASIYK